MYGLVIGALAAGAIFLLNRCNCDETPEEGGPGNGGNGTKDVGNGGSDGGVKDAGLDAGDAGFDAGPDPCIVKGRNHKFASPEYQGQRCSIIDLDLNTHKSPLTGMCAFNLNRMFSIDVDSLSPLAGQTVNFKSKALDQKILDGLTPGVKNVHPAQLEELSNGNILVPFADDTSPFVNGYAFIFPNGDVKWKTLYSYSYLGGGSSPDGGTMEMKPEAIQSGMLATVPDAEDKPVEKFFLAATDSAANQNFVLPLRLDASSAPVEFGMPISASGGGRSAIAPLKGIYAALRNNTGTPGASIDVIDLSAVDPADAVIRSIPLGVVATLDFPELAVTEDKNFAVVATERDIKIVDFDMARIGAPDWNPRVVGSRSLETPPRDVGVMGRAAYLTFENDVMAVDFSDPTRPVVIQTEPASNTGQDFGKLAVEQSGVVYVAATSVCGDDPDAGYDRWTNIVSLQMPTVAAPDAGTPDAGTPSDGGSAD